MSNVTVISLGGSIVVPDGVDVDFVRQFVALMRGRLEGSSDTRLAIVVGGGATARTYQNAVRRIAPDTPSDVLDDIGIAATRVNASVILAAFGDLCRDPLITDPTTVTGIAGRVILAGGWKPGFSTDNVAVRLAESLGATEIINLSNIKKIYTADPKIDPAATPIDEIQWEQFFKLVGDTWEPGKNTPFDPIATRRAAALGMTVIAADGRDLENLGNVLDGQPFVGTTIRP